MENLICPECGSTNLRKTNNNDIECRDCMTTIQKDYIVNSSYLLKHKMDIGKLKAEIENCVYNAACIIEAAEGLGLYHGNGHHAAQEIARFAGEVFSRGV